MKQTWRALLLSFVIISCGDRSVRNGTYDDVLVRKMSILLNRHEHFLTRQMVNKHRHNIPPAELGLYTAFIQNGLNQTIASNATINELINSDHQLTDSLLIQLKLIQRDNFIKLFDYRKAAATGRELMAKFPDALDSLTSHRIANKNRIYEGLQDTPAQRTVWRGAGVVKWTRDKIGLMTIPVATTDITEGFALDTRAGISTIMRSYADKLKLRMTGVTYEEGSGITGRTFQTELGIADSLSIGDLKVYNVVFQVLPDELLSFPSIDYSIKGIIGFPVILQWKHFTINNEAGSLTLLKESDSASLTNLAFDEAAIVLQTYSDKDTLQFYVDTGATSSELFYNFFNEKTSLVKRNARTDSIEVGGAGGIETKLAYILPTLNLTVGNNQATLQDVHILTKPTYKGQNYHGNLGHDFFRQFKEITFDFNKMSISVK
mgnify:CR=1 FL=1